MNDEQRINLSPLDAMLKEYHDGERGMPSYDELAALLNAHAPLHIFGAVNPEQNDQLARDAQAIVAADVAALASGRTLEKRMDSKKVDWMMCERISSEDHVDEALRNFSCDPTQDNASGLIQAALTVYLADSAAAAPQVVADERAARIESALARLLASDPTTAACSEDDLSAAVNDASAPPFVREQAAAMLAARAALASAAVQPVAVPDGWQATDDQIAAWAERHDLRISSATDRRAVFEDAESLRPGIAAPAAQGDAKATTKQVCTNCAGEGRFYNTVMTSFGGGEREETVCKVCVGSGVIYSAIAAKAAS